MDVLADVVFSAHHFPMIICAIPFIHQSTVDTVVHSPLLILNLININHQVFTEILVETFKDAGKDIDCHVYNILVLILMITDINKFLLLQSADTDSLRANGALSINLTLNYRIKHQASNNIIQWQWWHQ
ncbi:5063_t:CDS:2 [Gigaspora margarita]|uniref:5063_t:CDS:1 n=1 Tax=Gigaspora margarita TaxID=4874 RepID=A0ABN7UJX3_GIGMA|nr:5063_t:CDS:2 [Gigaspora margarita]